VKVVTGRQLCKVITQHGWELKRIRGSHHIFGQPGNPTILTVPIHGNKPLKIGTLLRLLKDAGLTEQDL
jgi:predicted RNA binding protein YcfA (HicA-like mRNA interferase family)